MNEVEIVVKSTDKTDFAAITSKARTSMDKSVKDGLDKVEKTTTDRLKQIGDKGGLSLSQGLGRGTRAVEKDTESLFGRVERLGSSAFNDVEKVGQSAFNGLSSAASSFAESGPQAIGLTVAAIGAVPFVAAAAETAITVGVGGALIGLGLMATKGSAGVESALHGMGDHIRTETKRIAAPFKQTWLEIAHDGQVAFDSLEPALQRSFDRLAPATSRFVHSTTSSFHEFTPAIDDASAAVTKLEDSLGGDMPSIVHSLSSAISIMANDVGKNSDEIAAMAQNTATLLPPLAAFLSYSVKLGQVVSPMFSTFTSANGMFNSFEKTLTFVSGGMLHLGNSSKKTATQLSPVSASALKVASDMKTLSDSEASATDRTNALSDAFDRLLNPQEAVFADAGKLKQAIHDMNAALKASHHHLGTNTQAARASHAAFVRLLDDSKAMAGDMLNAGSSVDDVRNRMSGYISALYRAAGANKHARALVDDFVRALQGVPGNKTTRLRSNADSERRQMIALQRQINSLRGKRITITTIERTIHYTQNQLIDRTSGPGRYGGRARGGVIGHAAEGGPRGNMTLVGEHGPELVSLPAGSTVRSNPDTARMLGNGGGGRMDVRLEVVGGDSEAQRMLVHLIKNYVRVTAGNGPDAVQKALRPA